MEEGRPSSGPELPETDFGGTARFQVQRRLGAGGMGVVYQAWDRTRERAVALKTLRRVDAAAIYQLKREFRALADIAHPNLVCLQELFAEGERWFFTMELVEGVDFLGWVRPGFSGAREQSTPPLAAARAGPSPGPAPPEPAPLDEQRLRSSLRQLCAAIAALHAAGRLHRDLKPSNVLVQRDGRVVVLDFGLATELQPARDERSLEQVVAGTPAYMAPEQAAMEPAGTAADWYAVGAMLYEALTGRPPFSGSQLQILMDKQRLEPPRPQESAPPGCADLCRLCQELLRRAPDARPGAAEVLARLGGAAAVPPLPSVSTGGSLPLEGREQVLAALREAFAEVRAGRAATVVLHGDAGVGVSTVARGFAELVRDEAGAAVIAGRCYEQESVPFKALDSLVDALSRYLMRLPRLEAEALLPRDVRALARMFPVLRRVEAIASAPLRGAQTPDQQELRNRAVRALRELLGRVADRRPLVLLIDGLHWADDDSVSLLAELLRAPEAPPMLLVACVRAEPPPPQPAEPALAQLPLAGLRAQLGAACALREIAVLPLSPEAARATASLLLARAGLPASHAEALARESGGSPFLLQELVRALQTSDGTGPLTLDGALRSRLDGLAGPVRQLLELIAVHGGPTPPEVAARACGIEGDPRPAFSLLRAAHLIRTSGDGERVETYHDRIRETLVRSLAPEGKRARHLQLAAAFEASQGVQDAAALALHFREAGNPERAADYAALAAARAAEALAFERAARLYRLSLELRPPGPRTRELEVRLGEALANAGLGVEAAVAYLAAAERPWATRAEAIELRRRAAEQYLRVGHVDEGLGALRAVLAEHGMRIATTPRRALASLLLWRARLALRGTRFEPRDPSQISAERLARIDVCWVGAVGLGMVDIIRGAAFQSRHLHLALEAGEPMRVARALASEAPFVATPGGPRAQRAAKRLVAQARELSRRIDSPHVTALAAFAGAVVAFLDGRWRACLQLGDEAAALFRDHCTGVAWELSNSHLFSLWALCYLGELRELRRRVDLLLREANARGDLYAATSLHVGLTNLALLVGDDVAAARREATEVLGRWSRQGFHFQHYWGLLAHGLTDLYAGDGAAAHARVEARWPELRSSLMLRIENVRIEGTHLRARSALAALDGSAADAAKLAAAARDARILGGIRAPWSQALAESVRAGVALARGDRAVAEARFDSARARFEALEMALFAAAAQRRVGELRGGDAGAALVAAADARMSAQGVVDPRRMSALFAPGA